MKNIALKRAKHCPAVKESLHPEFITEYADTSLFPEGFHKLEDGYEILPEDQFLDEYHKNEEYHQEFLEAKRQEEMKKQQAAAAAATAKMLEDKQFEREFEEFKRWKDKNKGKR